MEWDVWDNAWDALDYWEELSDEDKKAMSEAALRIERMNEPQKELVPHEG
jgi:hypothetical protein